MKILFLSLLFSAVPALATPPTLVTGTPPKSIVPHFSEWLAGWEKASSTSEELLLGTWILIGRAAAAKCSYQYSDLYDAQGIRSSPLLLSFSSFLTPQGTTALGVSLFRGSDANEQGPYLVDPAEPQFSKWAFNGTQLSKDGYYTYSCRRLAVDGSQIVCMLALKGNLDKYDDRTKACAAQDPGMAEVFVKYVPQEPKKPKDP